LIAGSHRVALPGQADVDSGVTLGRGQAWALVATMSKHLAETKHPARTIVFGWVPAHLHLRRIRDQLFTRVMASEKVRSLS
jgi:hypothetical protein